MAQMFFSPFFQSAEDIGRNFHWRQFMSGDVQANHAGFTFGLRIDIEGQHPSQGFDIFNTAAHQSFNGTDDTFRPIEQQIARHAANDCRTVRCVGHDGRHQGLAIIVTQDFGLAL